MLLSSAQISQSHVIPYILDDNDYNIAKKPIYLPYIHTINKLHTWTSHSKEIKQYKLKKNINYKQIRHFIINIFNISSTLFVGISYLWDETNSFIFSSINKNLFYDKLIYHDYYGGNSAATAWLFNIFLQSHWFFFLD